VITGGGSGLGLHTAKRLANEGAAVSIWDIDERALASARDSLGSACRAALAVDVSDATAVERSAATSAEALGRVDILIAAAGISGPNNPIVDYPTAAWDRVLRVNLNGVFHACRALVPRMRENDYGRIVNVSSIAGKEGNPNAGAYSRTTPDVRFRHPHLPRCRTRAHGASRPAGRAAEAAPVSRDRWRDSALSVWRWRLRLSAAPERAIHSGKGRAGDQE
jgi:NADP-dependent 3-hydroxy acid dehydrogenase YdfG